MNVDLFDFHLPDSHIALRPAVPRESAKLLEVCADGSLNDHFVADVADLFQPGDHLVVNDTRVIPARLFGHRDDVPIEVTLHQNLSSADPEVTRWSGFAKPGKRLKPGQCVVFSDQLTARVVEKRDGGEVVFDFSVPITDFYPALEACGQMPLPPYIAARRAVDAQDKTDYQTPFAHHDGAVAAPTAGLHFTPKILQSLENKGVALTSITLHVGAGTFLPVKAQNTDDHKMHSEWGCITADQAAALNQTRDSGGRIVAIGTTSLRLLESAATGDGLAPFEGTTDIFITPGYAFKAVDLLWTNFHLPKSTLFMLVSAFSGLETMKQAYAHAVDQNYRFYSYGDASLLHPKRTQ